MADYIPVDQALPEALTDVIGLVPDDDGPTRMLVFLHPDGFWLASQCERDIVLEVIAWTPMAPIPTRYLVEGV